jgi:FkbM family methyltransferase
MKRLAKRLMLSVPAPFVLVIAKLLTRTQPLRWVPGWRFGNGGNGLHFVYWLRWQLWRYGRLKQLQIPIQVKWYDDIWVNLYLGNDMSRCLFVGGTIEPNEFMFLAQILKEGMHFVDVGASVGLYSLFAAKRVGPRGRVSAFEPSSREFSRLTDHLRLNKTDNVRAFYFALSDRSGFASLAVAEDWHEGQNTLGAIVYPGVRQQRSEQVILKRLDNLIVEAGLPKIDVMKVDVEGAEYAVLNGARTVLREHRPVLMLEVLEPALRNQGSNREAIYELLRLYDYRLYCYAQSSGYPVPAATQELSENVVAVPVELELPSFES